LYDVLETITAPEEVRAGSQGEYLAVKTMSEGKTLVVVYKETDKDDGFVITAFLTRRLTWLGKRTKVWP